MLRSTWRAKAGTGILRKDIVSGLLENESVDRYAALMAHLSAEFNVPAIAEWGWGEYIYRELERRGRLCPMRVYVNEELGWPVDAVELSVREKDVLDVITDGLREGRISLPEGDVEAPPLGEYSTLAEYLREFAPYLAQKVERAAPPLHDIHADPLPAEIATIARVPFPVQAHAATAIYKGILAARKGKMPRVFFLNCGDMGTGKTQVANTVFHLLKSRFGRLRVLVLAPQITIPQWHKEEIMRTIPYAKVTVLNNWKETLRYIRRTKDKKPNGLEIVLMGHDRAKLGFAPWVCALYKRIRGSKSIRAWHCPDCHLPLSDPEDPIRMPTGMCWPMGRHPVRFRRAAYYRAAMSRSSGARAPLRSWLFASASTAGRCFAGRRTNPGVRLFCGLAWSRRG